MLSSTLAPGLLLPPLLERLQDRFASFLFLLRNDTTGVEERFTLIPMVLGLWLVASLLSAPLSHLIARLLGSSAELRESTGIAFTIAAIQCGFFGISWLVIAWGQRSLDWSVLGASSVATAFVSKWGHEFALWKCALHVLLQVAVGLLTMFLMAFAATEFGWTNF